MLPLVKSFEMPPSERLFDTFEYALALPESERFARFYAIIFVIDVKEYFL